jgi:hypothetical protein
MLVETLIIDEIEIVRSVHLYQYYRLLIIIHVYITDSINIHFSPAMYNNLVQKFQ